MLSRIRQLFNQTSPIKTLQQQAKEGQAEAQYQLGLLHEQGAQEVPRSTILAYRWYSAAAKQNHTKAHDRLLLLQAIVRAEDLLESE